MIDFLGSEQAFQYACHSRTNVGQRSENQDACGHWQSESWLIAIVADGAGGHAAGRLASALVVNEMLRQFRMKPTSDVSELTHMVYSVNEVLLARQCEDEHCGDMHTTLVAVVLNKATGVGVRLHAGDSRLYLFDSYGRSLLTEDHSMCNLLNHASSDVEQTTSRHTLYSALGEPSASLKVDVDLLPFSTHAYSLLLCTDGFWELWLRLESDLPIQWPITRQGIDRVFDHLEKNQPSRCDNFSCLAIYPDHEEEL
jgi:PPM family protein phosphatase